MYKPLAQTQAYISDIVVKAIICLSLLGDRSLIFPHQYELPVYMNYVTAQAGCVLKM